MQGTRTQNPSRIHSRREWIICFSYGEVATLDNLETDSVDIVYIKIFVVHYGELTCKITID